MSYRYLSVLLCLLLQACIGCRSELALLELLDTRPAHLATDTTQHEPLVNYKRPPYAQSIPSGYDYAQEPQPVQKSGLVGWVRSKVQGAKVKDKSRTTIIYNNAPTGNKNSNVATDNGTATNNTKAGQDGGAAATAPGATATATTEDSGTPWWLPLAGLAVGFVLGAVLERKKRWLPSLGGLLLLALLCGPPAKAQKQLVIPSSRYSYHEQRAAARRYKKVKRYYKRQNRRDDRQAAAEQRHRLKVLRDTKKELAKKSPR